MYTEINFKSKKALKEAIAKGEQLKVFQPNDMFHVGDKVKTGIHNVALEGPHYPQAHSWYASAKLENGIIKSVS